MAVDSQQVEVRLFEDVVAEGEEVGENELEALKERVKADDDSPNTESLIDEVDGGCGGSDIDNSTGRTSKSPSSLWRFFGRRLPRDEVVFYCQMAVIFTVVATSVYNLSVTTEQSELWTALLSSCLGYILPNPRLRAQ